jgi:ABC-2 type transport system permease protein
LAFPGLLGKLLPYFLIYLFYGFACIVWLAWGRGYPVAGSLWMLMLGYALMLATYIALGALIEACVRDQAMSLGAAAVYASSAITFSGAFFPIRGGVWFAQAWSAIQPYTWYTAISAQQWQMGAPAAVSFLPDLILAVEAAVLSAGAVLAVWYEAREREKTP